MVCCVCGWGRKNFARVLLWIPSFSTSKSATDELSGDVEGRDGGAILDAVYVNVEYHSGWVVIN